MDESEDVSRDEKFRAGKELFQEYMKKKQSKKKKKKEKKAKDEVLGSSSGADENTTSQSSVPISMDDSFVNLSEGETSDVCRSLDVQNADLPVNSGPGIDQSNQISQPNLPAAISDEPVTGLLDTSSVTDGSQKLTVDNKDIVQTVDSGLGTARSVQDSCSEFSVINSDRPSNELATVSTAEDRFMTPSMVQQSDSGLETLRFVQNEHLAVSEVNPPMPTSNQWDISTAKGNWQKLVDEEPGLLELFPDSPTQLRSQINDLQQQIHSSKVLHENELKSMDKAYTQKMEDYRKQVEEAANSQVQKLYADLNANLNDQQKQSEEAQAALLASLDKEQSSRRVAEEENNRLKAKISLIQTQLDGERMKNEQLNAEVNELECKTSSAIARDTDSKQEVMRMLQEEKVQMSKELERQIAEARSLSFRDFEDQLHQLTLQLEESQRRENQVLLSFNDLKARAVELEKAKEESAVLLENTVQSHRDEIAKLNSELAESKKHLNMKENERVALISEHRTEKEALSAEHENAVHMMTKKHQSSMDEMLQQFQEKEGDIRHSESIWQQRFYSEQEKSLNLEEQLEELIMHKEKVQDLEEVNSNLLSQLESLNQSLGEAESKLQSSVVEQKMLIAAKGDLQREVNNLARQCETMESSLEDLRKKKDRLGEENSELVSKMQSFDAQSTLREPPHPPFLQAVENREFVGSGVGNSEIDLMQQLGSLSVKVDTHLQKSLKEIGIAPKDVGEMITKLSASLSARSDEIILLEQKSSAMQNKIDNLVKEVNDATSHLESANQEVAALKKEKEFLETEAQRYAHEANQEQRQVTVDEDAALEELRAENAQLKLELATIKDETTSVRSRLHEIVAGKSGLEGELQKERELLSHKLKEKESLEVELMKHTSELERKQTEKQMLENLLNEKCKLEKELLAQKDHLLSNLANIQEKLKQQEEEEVKRQRKWQEEKDLFASKEESLQRQLEESESNEKELKREFSRDVGRIKAELDSTQLQMQQLQEQSTEERRVLIDDHNKKMKDMSNQHAEITEKIKEEHTLEVERLNAIVLKGEERIKSLQSTIESNSAAAERQNAALQENHQQEKEAMERVISSKIEALTELAEKHEQFISNLSEEHAKTLRTLMEKVDSLDKLHAHLKHENQASKDEIIALQRSLEEKETKIKELDNIIFGHQAEVDTAVKCCEETLREKYEKELQHLRAHAVESQNLAGHRVKELETQMHSKLSQLEGLLQKKESEIMSLCREQNFWHQEKAAMKIKLASLCKPTHDVALQNEDLLTGIEEHCENVLAVCLVDAAISNARCSLLAQNTGMKMDKALQISQMQIAQLKFQHDKELTDLENTLHLEHKRQCELLEQKYMKDLQETMARVHSSLKSTHTEEICNVKLAAEQKLCSAIAQLEDNHQQSVEALSGKISEKETEIAALNDLLEQERSKHQEQLVRLEKEYVDSAKICEEELDSKRHEEYQSALIAMQNVHQQEREDMISLHRRNIAQLEGELADSQMKNEELKTELSQQQQAVEDLRARNDSAVDKLKHSIQAEVRELQSQLTAEKEKHGKLMYEAEQKNKILNQIKTEKLVNTAFPFFDSDEFAIVDASLLLKLANLAPTMKEEAKDLNQLADHLNNCNLHEMQAAIAELQKNVASQDATSTEETFMSPKMAYLAEELQAEKMTLLNQLAALKEQLQMSQVDCDHARELASKADIDLQLLKTKNEKSLKQLEEVNMVLKSEQEELTCLKHLVNLKDHELRSQEAKRNEVLGELAVCQSRTEQLTAAMQLSQQELENAKQLLQAYFSGTDGTAKPQHMEPQKHSYNERPSDSWRSEAPLATQCQQLLQVLSDTQDCMESTSSRLTAKQNEVKILQKLYRKSENCRRNLAFQKSYLTQKVDSFFYTQQAAFDILQDMGLVDVVHLHCQSPCVSPRQRFRARVWVVIAQLRIVRLWRKAERI